MQHFTDENADECNGPYRKNKMDERKLEGMKVETEVFPQRSDEGLWQRQLCTGLRQADCDGLRRLHGHHYHENLTEHSKYETTTTTSTTTGRAMAERRSQNFRPEEKYSLLHFRLVYHAIGFLIRKLVGSVPNQRVPQVYICIHTRRHARHRNHHDQRRHEHTDHLYHLFMFPTTAFLSMTISCPG